MAMWTTFEDIDAWKKARVFNQQCEFLFIRLKDRREYGLHGQMSRAAGSIMDNIAEGLGRGGNKEFRQFLYYSRGSAMEVHSQLIRCYDKKLRSKEEFNQLIEDLQHVHRLLGGLLKYLQSSSFKGQKFQ